MRYVPERTCRLVAKDRGTWFICSECLYGYAPPALARFCPICGCRVEAEE